MKHEFCDHCPGCRPAFLDVKTMKPLAGDSPTMIIVNKVWDTETTYAMRKAFIDVTLHNSEKEVDRLLASQVIKKFEEALKRSPE